jgi:flagellar motor protein MotB
LGWLALAGCTQNPYLLQSKNKSLQQEQVAMQQKSQELQSRAVTLDKDNQELEALLAQARQQSKLLEDQLVAVREQLAGATAQLAQVRDEKQLTERQAEAMVASARRRSGATITANSSFARSAPAINIPGIEVRQDGDVLRVELPGNQFFQPGTATLQPNALALLDTISAELARAYPEQLIGIEGHTEGDAASGANWAQSQQLSISRSLAVYQQLAARGTLRPQQLFTVGHGSNHPVVSNATPQGQQRNSRVELVVYPERVAGR